MSHCFAKHDIYLTVEEKQLEGIGSVGTKKLTGTEHQCRRKASNKIRKIVYTTM